MSSDTRNVDWATLRQIGPKNLVSASKNESMPKIVLLRNLDFTLQKFTPEPDLSINASEGKTVAAAPDKGIAILKARGTIERYYSECGFYRSDLSSWKTLAVDTGNR